MYCPYCSKYLPDGVYFCSHCGKTLVVPSNDSEQNSRYITQNEVFQESEIQRKAEELAEQSRNFYLMSEGEKRDKVNECIEIVKWQEQPEKQIVQVTLRPSRGKYIIAIIVVIILILLVYRCPLKLI